MTINLRDVLIVSGIVFVFGWVLWISAVGIHDGWLPTSEQKSTDLYVPSEVMIEVSADGTSVIVKAHYVSAEVRALVGTAYRDPAAAEEAVSGMIEDVHEAGYESAPGWLKRTLDFLGMSPAYAHAVNVCWNGNRPKVSHQTGAGRHITKHRYDTRRFRYTKTDHQILRTTGYHTTSIYRYKVNKKYC